MINLRQNKTQLKVYFGSNLFPYFAITLLICFISCFFINLHSQAKDYQKFRFFISTSYVDDEKILNYVDTFNYDSIYEKHISKYDCNDVNFDNYFSTQGTFNTDIFILTKDKIDKSLDSFLSLGACFKENEFTTYRNVAIKIYDSELNQGPFKQFLKKEFEKDLYIAININSFHYLSSKDNCTNFAPIFIRGLING